MKNLIILAAILLIVHSTYSQNCVSCEGNTVNYLGVSSAIGVNNSSMGLRSFASGEKNSLKGDFATALGFGNSSNGESAFAAGNKCNSAGLNSIALGERAQAFGRASFAAGFDVMAKSPTTFAIGSGIDVWGSNSIAIGHFLKTTVSGAFVIGYGAGTGDNYLMNTTTNSLMIGFKSTNPTFFVGESPDTDKTGRIGIGNVTNPLTKLHIKADPGEDAIIRLTPDDWSGNYTATIEFGDADYSIIGKYSKGLIFNSNNKDFIFNTGVTGEVGIGTSLPTQTLDVDGTSRIRDDARFDGNVGIGITTPSERLEVDGNILQSSGFYLATSQIKAPDATGLILSDQNGDGITIIEGGYTSIGTLATSNYRLAIGGDLFATGQVTSSSLKSNQLEAYNSAGLMLTNQNGNGIFIDDDGNVGIATTNIQDGYILTIDGKVVAEEVLIQNSDTWYDFVFEEGYDLPNLSDLDNFIKQNKHLPDVPTAEEVAENGYELGKMNGILLKKVEELTLYVIEQQKMMEGQQRAYENQQKEIENQQQELKKLKEKVGSLQ